MKRVVRNRVVSILGAGLILLLGANVVKAGDTEQAGSDMGMGLAAVGTNLFYVPVKVGYSLLGGLTGGVAYALTGGNRDVADRIWVPSMGGDYVVTPEHLSGEEEIYFSGLRRTSRDAASAPAAAEAEPGAGVEGVEGAGAADSFESEGAREKATF